MNNSTTPTFIAVIVVVADLEQVPTYWNNWIYWKDKSLLTCFDELQSNLNQLNQKTIWWNWNQSYMESSNAILWSKNIFKVRNIDFAPSCPRNFCQLWALNCSQGWINKKIITVKWVSLRVNIFCCYFLLLENMDLHSSRIVLLKK